MYNYKMISAAITDEDFSTILLAIKQHHKITLDELEPKLIRRLEEKYHYSQLIDGNKDPFQDLLILLSADEPSKRIRALQSPENQVMLRRIYGSAYKYAQIVEVCKSDEVTYEEVDAALKEIEFFSDVLFSGMSEVALNNINKPRNGVGMLEAACEKFDDEIKSQMHSKVFTSGTDFPAQETFLHVLNMTSVDSWPALFNLPDMERHLTFSFENNEDAEALFNILDVTRRIEFFMWPGMMQSILNALRDENRDELIESNNVFRVCFYEWISDIDESDEDAFLDSFDGSDTQPEDENPETIDESVILPLDQFMFKTLLERPNALEAILTAFHKNRWALIANDARFQEAFIQRIGQGRGDQVLKLLGDAPDDAASDDLVKAVYAAAIKGFDELNETQGLSSAQCKQWHFFSPQKPHPFLEELEKKMEATKNQGLSAMRLK